MSCLRVNVSIQRQTSRRELRCLYLRVERQVDLLMLQRFSRRHEDYKKGGLKRSELSFFVSPLWINAEHPSSAQHHNVDKVEKAKATKFLFCFEEFGGCFFRHS